MTFETCIALLLLNEVQPLSVQHQLSCLGFLFP